MTWQRIERNVLRLLVAGFSLTIVVLLGSAWLGMQALEALETQTEDLLSRRRVSTQLIDEIQKEQTSLNSLFYELVADPDPDESEVFRARLEGIETDVRRTLESARGETNPSDWRNTRTGIESFLAEARKAIAPDRSAARSAPDALASLLLAHEEMEQDIGELVQSNYKDAIAQEAAESSAHQAFLRRALILLAVGLALALVCAVITVRAAGRMFHRMAWQARELSRLSRHVLENQEHMLQRFSRELHDEFGQSLTAIEANLAAVPADSPAVAAHLEDCTLLVKDLMSSVRDLSQLLRPSTLDDFGLKASLHGLAESFAQRTGIAVEPHLEFDRRLHGEIETHLYRIAQEALTNAARHANATKVVMTLAEEESRLRLTIADNGGGLRSKGASRGMGLAGMRERMRIAGGTLDVKTNANGVTVIAEVVLDEAAQRAKADPSLVGG